MKEVSHRESFAIIARALGAVFYFPPDSEQAAPLVTALTTTDWYRDWPLAEESLLPVADKLRATTDETLPEAWQRLFIGPWALPAPPWGSVWLDRESVLLGSPLSRCVSGCAITALPSTCRKTSRKIISGQC